MVVEIMGGKHAMKTIIHRSETRGTTEKGWLHAYHTFGFGDYYDPARMGFGTLQVLNEVTLAPGAGLDMHRHENMEIITIALDGVLEYRDGLGNVGIIGKGEFQVLSAGTGIYYSEYNRSEHDMVRYLQIWILPRENGLFPRYSRVATKEPEVDMIKSVIAPSGGDSVAWINQDAYISLGRISKGEDLHYRLHKNGNGLYIFLLHGAVSIEEEFLYNNDGMGITETETVDISSLKENTRLLLIEIPMKRGGASETDFTDK